MRRGRERFAGSAASPLGAPAALAGRRAFEPREMSIQELRLEWSEAQFQSAVEGELLRGGWRFYHTRDSRGSRRGFPDLVAVRSGRLVFAELKTMTGGLEAEQPEWLSDLGDVASSAELVEVYLWRPSDWDVVEGVLR